MKYSLQDFLLIIEQKNLMHAKTLKNSMTDITGDEVAKFENLLAFYMMRENNDIEQIADKYLNLLSYLMDEQFYFAQYDKYRFSTFVEVENYYKNTEYMSSYAVGLGLSTYLWKVHRDMMRLFVKYLKSMLICVNGGGKYLEVGPGHGEYLATALMNTNFDHYTAVDISPTCVEMSKDFVNYTIGNLNKNCDIINKDFFDYKTDKPFDAVVAGEILEHVENPLPFLDKIYQVADDNARVFITTAINAPQPDHIYLFNNLNEVTDLLKTAGFSVVDYVATNTNNVPIEKAEKRKIPIVVGFILKKII